MQVNGYTKLGTDAPAIKIEIHRHRVNAAKAAPASIHGHPVGQGHFRGCLGAAVHEHLAPHRVRTVPMLSDTLSTEFVMLDHRGGASLEVVNKAYRVMRHLQRVMQRPRSAPVASLGAPLG